MLLPARQCARQPGNIPTNAVCKQHADGCRHAGLPVHIQRASLDLRHKLSSALPSLTPDGRQACVLVTSLHDPCNTRWMAWAPFPFHCAPPSKERARRLFHSYLVGSDLRIVDSM